jgi:hypothetical protein
MASATSTDDDALHETAAAPCGFASLPLDVISTHILSHDFLPEPRDLGRLRAVSKYMRDAVDATGREIKKLSDWDAARLGYVSLLKERFSRGVLKDEWDQCLKCLVCAAAARNGDLEALKALLEDGYPWNEKTCAFAAWGGQLEILKWARANDCPWNEETCAGAAEGGQLEVLKWACENGCPWNVRTCSYAAEGGHFETLKWLHENGCEWHEETCEYAASGGQLEILKWLRANDCPWDEGTCDERGEARPPRDAEVGARERLPVELLDV